MKRCPGDALECKIKLGCNMTQCGKSFLSPTVKPKLVARYVCPECGQNITLYGPKEICKTKVICEKCGVWMGVGNQDNLPTIINSNGDAGDLAFETAKLSFANDEMKK